MTRETKIGMLVGMGVIVIAAIFISDYLAGESRPQPAELSQLELEQARYEQIRTTPPPTLPAASSAPATPVPATPVVQPRQPLPQPHELVTTEPAAPSRPLFSTDRLVPMFVPESGDSRAAQPAQPVAPQPVVQPAPVETATPQPAPTQFQPDRLITGQRPVFDNRRTATGDLVHFVEDGDNLTDIAKRYYGDGQYARVIYEANRDKMSSINAIRVGVRLVIPNRAGLIASPAQPNQVNVAPAPQPVRTVQPQPTRRADTYTVQPGDTLSEIAQEQLGSIRHLPKLMELNGIDNPNSVFVGQKLRLPRN